MKELGLLGRKNKALLTYVCIPHLFQVARVMFSVAMFITYALMLFVPIEIIWPILRKRVKNEAWKKPLERVFRCFLVLCTFAIAMAIPHLGRNRIVCFVSVVSVGGKCWW